MAEPLWTSDAIARATGGAPSAAFTATGVSIDTRTLQPGDLFVALAGERDGHEFVGQAMAAGAAGALVSRPIDGPAVVVDDSLRGLERLGAAARDRSGARRCAVTGSVGKTGVTQAIAAGLALAGAAHSAVKSYNNHIGVPLTLARMPAATERAVFEIGMNHAGEIGPLSRLVRPHVAVVTTVGAVHVENFPDGEPGVARAKAEVFEGLEPGGVAVLNADNPWFDGLATAARAQGVRVVSFGKGEACDARLLSFSVSEGAAVRAVIHGREVNYPLAQTGAHWGPNSLAVLLALETMEVSLEVGMQALVGFAPLAGRGAETEVGGIVIIDESYNANPLSMRAALSTLAARPAEGRRIAALTDMLELGPDAAKAHAVLASEAAASADLVFTAGPLMRSLYEALPRDRRGAWAETAEELAPLVAEALAPGDVVMVKGSNGSRASAIVRELERFAAAGLIGESLQNAGGS